MSRRHIGRLEHAPSHQRRASMSITRADLVIESNTSQLQFHAQESSYPSLELLNEHPLPHLQFHHSRSVLQLLRWDLSILNLRLVNSRPGNKVRTLQHRPYQTSGSLWDRPERQASVDIDLLCRDPNHLYEDNKILRVHLLADPPWGWED